MSNLAKSLVAYYATGLIYALETGREQLAAQYARMAWDLIR